MAQLGIKFQMFTFAPAVGTLAAGAALTIPGTMPRCHFITIKNMDATNDVTVYTDPTDATAIDTAPAGGGTFDIKLNPALAGFGPGELVCYLKSAGAAPVIFAYE
jgi:hypothetical protein